MTLLGKIFRPWDLTSDSDESFVGKSKDLDLDAGEVVREKVVEERCNSSASTIRMEEGNNVTIPSSEKKQGILGRRMLESGSIPTTRLSSSSSITKVERKHPPMSISLDEIKLDDGSNGRVSSSHFLDLSLSAAAASSLPYFIPSSPVSTPSTASSFMSSSSINELASLSRSDLTAMGLLPPEPPSSVKVKRQRPKRFRCPHCQVAFSNNGQLRGHIRIHTGERPFSCEHDGCGKSFTRNEELTRHRRIHTGLRPYPCTHCGKKFGRKDHLKKHTRTHQRPMYNHPSSGMIGLGNPFHPFNPSLIPSPSAINEFASTSSPYALPFMLSIPPPISHFPFS